MNQKGSPIAFFAILAAIALCLSACSNPQPGPDKTLVGGTLGAGWGAGAGAVIGNQLTSVGNGAGLGAAFGLAAGALSGMSDDLVEGAALKQQRELAMLRAENQSNRQGLRELQANLDDLASRSTANALYQVYFDPDETSLRAGAVANLEAIAENLKASPSAGIVNISGHADDSGDPDYNKRLAEARARSVSAYLGSRGLAMDQLRVSSFGSTRPIASNASAEGRQLNRRVDIAVVHTGR